MKKTITYIIILLLTMACSEIKKTESVVKKEVIETKKGIRIPDRIEYVQSPKSTDSLCNSDIRKAQNDIKNGKIAYVQTAGFGFGRKRYESDLKKLCKEKGLEYELDLIGCIFMEGQTPGCYGAYMDKTLIEKFGNDFKEKLNEQADSLFLERIVKNNIAIFSWDCDVEPKPILESKSYLETTLDVPKIDLKRTELAKTWPAIDLNFIIERDGTISKFFSKNFIANLNHNEKFKKELYNIAVRHIKTNYPKWKAGTIRNTPVRTEHNLRITFIGQ